MTAEDLARHVTDASDLLALIEERPPASFTEPAARAALVRARDALRAARESAGEPFGVGLVGELSAGKSLLLGTLLGLPELLPVGDEAVTGNVTVVHAGPAPADQGSRQKAVHVEYFTEEQAAEYLRHLRDELGAHAAQAGLDQHLLDTLRRIRLDSPDCAELVAFRDVHLGGELARQLAGTLGELRLVEQALARAARSGRRLLGARFELDDRLAGAAVVLPGPEGGAAVDPRTQGGAMDMELLRATMPLVRRVVRHVEVDRAVWDLTDFPGGALRLFDFPGLNSAFSAVRDQYVCAAELRSVHTVLILLKTTGGATDTPERLVRMWHGARRADGLENSVLAAVSRFHELPVSQALLKPLTDEPGPLTRDPVLDTVPLLRELLAGAERLVAPGRADRVVLTSAIRALATSRLLAGLGPEFRRARHFDTQLPLAEARAGLWRDIGERLERDDVGGPLGGMLTAFAADGGLGRLRRALLDHVTEHGVALRLAQLDGRRRQAAEALRELYGALGAGGPGPADAFHPGGSARADAGVEAGVRKGFIALLSVWEEIVARCATDLLDARSLHLPGDPHEAQGPTLFDELEGDAAERVFAWESWRRLLDAVRDEHVDPGSLPFDRPPPLTADDLFAEFRDTCRDIESRNASRLLAAVEHWLVGYQHRLVTAARELGGVITPEAFERLKSAAPADNDLLMDRLQRATTLGWLRDSAEKAVREEAPDDASEMRLRARFPLRPGQVLPWHPESNAALYARHQTIVARYRRDMAAMVLHECLARLADAQRAVCARLASQADGFLAEVRTSQVSRALLTAVADEARHPDTAGFAEQVRVLAEPSVYSWHTSPARRPAGLLSTTPGASLSDVFRLGGA
ncbi:dynamin family protein [Streptomyces sp. VRA16 Mangrove soil]|uniref:dynamin family protein n=1 Tax=Streptomyces sp. VRA16 Mangrove soil TaxID=2817434 RepID=UPI001A9D03F7|nr:dynamin family protein [Streptomyces sp. VRA16 Mangrove soil]MBO1330890.1 dynamin family protein [Streptomyces sp. VRA16 Mangrove soil]